VTTLLVVVLAVTASLVLTPLVRNWARRHGYVDQPDGRRKQHVDPVPRVGGIAVFVAFVVSFGVPLALTPDAAWYGPNAVPSYLHLLVACAAILAVGLADDLVGFSPLGKIAVQTVAALYLYVHGYRIEVISNPLGGESVSVGILSIPLTVVWFVGMSNAFNLIDGLDGLAAGIGLFSTTTIFITSVVNERIEVALLSAALAGALLGFLRYNFNPASIFLGDSGSLFIGFALAAFAIRGSMKSSAAIAVAAPLLALAVPIVDAAVAILRRLISGKSLFEADGDHIHHRLLRKGFSPRAVVVTLYGVAAAFGALSLLTMTERGQVLGLVVIASSVVTWIGIQQLGYSEFGEVQRVLRYGFAHERRGIANNLYLIDLKRRLAEARSIHEVWNLLLEGARRLGFQALELALSPAGQEAWERAGDDRPNPPVAWRTETVSSAPRGSCTWSLPLGDDGRMGRAILSRDLDVEREQFRQQYLVAAFGSAAGEAIRRLSATANVAATLEPKVPALPGPARRLGA
jgi:UDP-GlcNAc:undecaprenyl-phosphate GlcNAc-1-phosphate transferase